MAQCFNIAPGSLDDVVLTPWLHPLPGSLSGLPKLDRSTHTQSETNSPESSNASEERRIIPSSDYSDSPQDTNEVSLGQKFVFADVTSSAPIIRSRRGHKKSRAGCFNCKKWKIKCQENRPSCHNCSRRDVICVYPISKTISVLHNIEKFENPNPVRLVNLQTTPTVFTMTDMRLFHHYLQGAYPHLPINNDKTWLSQVPLIAHQNEYLMYGILGLAASNLAALTGENLETTAIQYRLKAIQGFYKAISKKLETESDGDAALGCAYLLTFQSIHMSDGFEDFFQFVKGCHLLSRQIRKYKLPSRFSVDEEDHIARMEPRLLDLPVIEPELLASAGMSLSQMRHLLYRRSHSPFHKLLSDCIEGAKVSSTEGYWKFISIFESAPTMDAITFRDFTDPENAIARLLIAHFVAIQMILSPLLHRGWSHRQISPRTTTNIKWIFSISEKLPDKLKEYCLWPRSIAEAIDGELSGSKSAAPKLHILQGMKERSS